MRRGRRPHLTPRRLFSYPKTLAALLGVGSMSGSSAQSCRGAEDQPGSEAAPRTACDRNPTHPTPRCWGDARQRLALNARRRASVRRHVLSATFSHLSQLEARLTLQSRSAAARRNLASLTSQKQSLVQFAQLKTEEAKCPTSQPHCVTR